MKKGLFITMEGPDGSGKSTQLDFLKDYFEKRGEKALFTREPGGTPISEKIRNVILDKENLEMDSVTEAFLYAASRAQLVSQVIKPALERGRTVVCDRYVDSSIAYQGYGRKLGDMVEKINTFATQECEPDITFLLKLDSQKGIKRIEESSEQRGEKDRLEEETISFHNDVLMGYMELEKKYPDRIIGIDANKSIEEVRTIIEDKLNYYFGVRNNV
ncbi:MAG: dTMP kinase [Anaerovoracaceae bacterium]